MVEDLPGHAGSVFAVDWAPNGWVICPGGVMGEPSSPTVSSRCSEMVASGGADKTLKLCVFRGVAGALAMANLCVRILLPQVAALGVFCRRCYSNLRQLDLIPTAFSV